MKAYKKVKRKKAKAFKAIRTKNIPRHRSRY